MSTVGGPIKDLLLNAWATKPGKIAIGFVVVMVAIAIIPGKDEGEPTSGAQEVASKASATPKAKPKVATVGVGDRTARRWPVFALRSTGRTSIRRRPPR